jgi:hypothetical protein
LWRRPIGGPLLSSEERAALRRCYEANLMGYASRGDETRFAGIAVVRACPFFRGRAKYGIIRGLPAGGRGDFQE